MLFHLRILNYHFSSSSAVGNDIANLNNLDLLNFNGQNNVLADAALDRWSTENPNGKYPRALAAGNNDQGVLSTAIVEDASYLQVKKYFHRV